MQKMQQSKGIITEVHKKIADKQTPEPPAPGVEPSDKPIQPTESIKEKPISTKELPSDKPISIKELPFDKPIPIQEHPADKSSFSDRLDQENSFLKHENEEQKKAIESLTLQLESSKDENERLRGERDEFEQKCKALEEQVSVLEADLLKSRGGVNPSRNLAYAMAGLWGALVVFMVFMVFKNFTGNTRINT